MATVIEEALIAIKPDFSRFKEELTAGLKEATAGTKVKVTVEADTAAVVAKVRAAADEAGKTTAKVKADVDTAPAKAKLKALSSEKVTVKAKVEAEGDFISPVQQRMLRQQVTDLLAAQRAAQKQMGSAEAEAYREKARREAAATAASVAATKKRADAEVAAYAEDYRRAQAQRAKMGRLEEQAYNEDRQRTAKKVADAQKLQQDIEKAERAAHAENDRRNKKAADDADAAAEKARKQREVLGKAEAQAYRENAKREQNERTQGFRKFAEYLNVLPGIGGVGPHAARTIAIGITAGAPLIGAAISSAVALGFGVGGIATGIVIAAKDYRVKAAATSLAADMGQTLQGAARPFADELALVIPQIGIDFAALKPKIADVLTPLGKTLPKIEQGLAGFAQAALPGMATAARNAAQYIDAIAKKGPAIGKAFGTLVADLTDPKGVGFLKGLLDFIDAAVVDIGKLVKAFTDLYAVLHPVLSVVGDVVDGVTSLVGGLSQMGNPGFAAGILTIAAAYTVFGARVRAAAIGVKTMWAEATAAAKGYNATTSASSVGFGMYTGPAGPQAQPGFFGRMGALANSRLGTGVILGASLAATAGGSALANAGHPILGGALSGAGVGAGVGMFGSPVAAAGGAAVGAAVGSVTGAMSAQKQTSDTLASSLKQLADSYKSTGQISQEFVSQLAAGDSALRDLALHSHKYGVELPSVVQAIASGSPEAIQAQIDAIRTKQGAADKTPTGLAALSPILAVKKYFNEKDFDAAADALTDDKAAAEAVKAAMDALTPALDQNAVSWKKVTDAITANNTVFSNFQSQLGDEFSPEVKTVNTVADAYASYLSAQRSADDARYSAAQTAQSTAQANENALHGVTEAEHGLAEAHYATEQAQKSLTQARKDAIQNLKDLQRQVRDIGDNEEELKIRLVEAQLAEVQTRGLPAEALARRQAVVSLDEARNALADFQADAPALRDKLALAQKQGVEGTPDVVDAKHSLAESRRNELEQQRNLKLAHENYANTLESSRHQNELARRAVDDANTAFDKQGKALGDLLGHLNLTKDAAKALYENSKLLDHQFNLQITDNGSAKISLDHIYQQYQGLAQLAKLYGIDVVQWTPPSTGETVPFGPVPQHKGPVQFKAAGGLVGGWSPHDAADNIPAMLNAEEFVVNAKSTRKHRMALEAINADRFYSGGGFVLPLNKPIDTWWEPIQQNINALMGSAGVLSSAAGGSSVAAVQNWLKGTVDPLPYVMGANGPTAYDCSSLVGEVWARLTGNADYKRYFVTGNERAFLTAHGFKPGTGTFTVGFNAGHTMGNLGGLNFEAANSRDGILIGPHTSNVLSFPNVMYLPQLGDKFVSVPGGGTAAPKAANVTVGGLWGGIIKQILTSAARVNSGIAGGGDPGKAAGTGVNRWRATVEQALRDNGFPASNDYVNAVLRQIVTESSGNELAIQKVHDVNWPNNLARGLMQTTPPTFLQYAFPGHGNIYNGYDNLLAALNYVKHRYHGDVLGVLGHGHGYDAGGWLKDFGYNATGSPEAVLTPTESRAYVKHAEAVSSNGGEMRLDDWTINRLAQALSTRPAHLNLDGRRVADAVIPHLTRRF
ncbi:MAG TPA: transglycosylase SLT domain-containing protein [Candidatus Binatia bacterium]|nr:transglycosylase SLT domain-containing protein [Candidatus Binatia bacterium]